MGLSLPSDEGARPLYKKGTSETTSHRPTAQCPGERSLPRATSMSTSVVAGSAPLVVPRTAAGRGRGVLRPPRCLVRRTLLSSLAPSAGRVLARAPRLNVRAGAGSPGGGGDGGSTDREYYDAWAKYPDDPAIPPEVTALLREVGDGPPDVWATKPSWCQPWTIMLCGSAAVYAPTAVFHAKWLSALVALPVGAWWYVFLVVFPKQFAEYVEAARGYYDRR